MLRSLLYRKVFVATDILLVALVSLAAAMVFMAVFSGEDTSAGSRERAYEEIGDEAKFASVLARTAYEPIIGSGLFGPAANASREAPKKAAPAAPPPPVETDTELPLRLVSTVETGEASLRTASIEVREGAATIQMYSIGDEVLDNVFLKEVYAREVLLDNRGANRLEHLRMLEGAERYKVADNKRPRRPSARDRVNSNKSITLSRNEIVRDLVQNFDEIANQIEVEEYRDSSGKVKGITASNLSSVPLAAKLGLEDGDVLTSVNNEPIDSVDKVYEVIEKHRNATTFRIGIIRGGKPRNIYYRIR